MKKIILILIIFAFIGSFYFASQAWATSNKPKTFIGKVTAITIGDEAKKIWTTITVVADSGETSSFQVRPGSNITTDKKQTKVSVDGIKVGDMVKIKYKANNDGTRRIHSMDLLR